MAPGNRASAHTPEKNQDLPELCSGLYVLMLMTLVWCFIVEAQGGNGPVFWQDKGKEDQASHWFV